jgi:hypothetical protein
VLHWLQAAFDTYLLHPLHANGYQWWSGAGSDLSELAMVGAAFGAWRHVNCAAPWCLRLGKHRTADGQHRLCRKHHPDLPDGRMSLEQIHARHAVAKLRQRGRAR